MLTTRVQLVAKHSGVVEINGNRYDAATGQIVNAIKSVKTQVIDGFVKSPTANTPKKPTVTTAYKLQSEPKKLHAAQPPAGNLHARTEKAHTLMRGGLKKPSMGFAQRLQKSTPGLSPERELRAKKILKHARVERFGIPSARQPVQALKAQRQVISGEVVNKAGAAAAVADPLPSMITSVSHQKLERLLDQALASADAHKQALKYQAARHFWQRPRLFGRRKWLTISGIMVIGVIAAFAVAWQEVPQLSVRMAGLRAHVSAAEPTYKPEGYALAGPATAGQHAVTMEYKADSDSTKSYTVKEQASSQDSSSLLANNSSPNQQVQKAQVNGVPIVIIAHKAMCVSQGVQTTVDDKADLAPDELLNIAKSVCG